MFADWSAFSYSKRHLGMEERCVAPAE